MLSILHENQKNTLSVIYQSSILSNPPSTVSTTIFKALKCLAHEKVFSPYRGYFLRAANQLP